MQLQDYATLEEAVAAVQNDWPTGVIYRYKVEWDGDEQYLIDEKIVMVDGDSGIYWVTNKI